MALRRSRPRACTPTSSTPECEEGLPNLVDESLQTTRRFDALKLALVVSAGARHGRAPELAAA